MGNATVTQLNSKDEYRKVVMRSDIENTVIAIDAFATWCGPCKTLAPHYEALAGEMRDVQFFKFDVDAVPDIAQELGISQMPTIAVFKNGDLFDKLQSSSPPAIKELITKAKA